MLLLTEFCSESEDLFRGTPGTDMVPNGSKELAESLTLTLFHLSSIYVTGFSSFHVHHTDCLSEEPKWLSSGHDAVQHLLSPPGLILSDIALVNTQLSPYITFLFTSRCVSAVILAGTDTALATK